MTPISVGARVLRSRSIPSRPCGGRLIPTSLSLCHSATQKFSRSLLKNRHMEVPDTSVSDRTHQLRLSTAEITTAGGYKISNRVTAKVCSNLSDRHQAAMFEDSMLLPHHPPISNKTNSFRERHYSIVCPDTLSIARLFVPEDRPLLEVPRSTGNHPKKGSPLTPAFHQSHSFRMRRAVLERSCECLAKEGCISTFASLAKLHATTFQKASTHDSHPDCLC